MFQNLILITFILALLVCSVGCKSFVLLTYITPPANITTRNNLPNTSPLERILDDRKDTNSDNSEAISPAKPQPPTPVMPTPSLLPSDPTGSVPPTEIMNPDGWVLRAIPAEPELKGIGATIRPTVLLQDANGKNIEIAGYTLVWTSEQPGLLQASPDGTLTSRAATGIVTVTLHLQQKPGVRLQFKVKLSPQAAGGGGGGGGGGGAAPPNNTSPGPIVGTVGDSPAGSITGTVGDPPTGSIQGQVGD